MRRRAGVLAAVPFLFAALATPTSAGAQDAADFFQKNCTACHTIGGGKRVGPDLAGVLERAHRDWLVTFINDPQGVMASGDPYALKLKSDMNGALMVKVPGMTPELAGRLLDYIAAQSGGPAAAVAAAPPPPPAPGEAVTGRRLFTGDTPLAGGGPPCVSCHVLPGLPSFGGGRLGPDLTQASSRLGGPQGLAAWLGSPPMPTMRATFGGSALRPTEIAALAALLQYTNQIATAPPPGPSLRYMGAGAAGAAVLLLIFGLVWRRRLRGVRAPLLQAQHREATHG